MFSDFAGLLAQGGAVLPIRTPATRNLRRVSEKGAGATACFNDEPEQLGAADGPVPDVAPVTPASRKSGLSKRFRSDRLPHSPGCA